MIASACVVIACASSLAAIQDAPPSSAIERALTDRTCDRLLGTRTTDVTAHEGCVAEQLVSLRADFGRDLSRVSVSDRNKLDSVCNPLARAESRERYLDCVNAQLAALRQRLRRGQPATPDASSQPSPTASLPAAAADAPRMSAAIWIGVAAVPLALAGAAAGVVWVRKRRQPAQACSVCGIPVTDAGGLCAACRHEAAEARRREATERAAGAKREAERRQQAAEAEERRAEDHARRLALEHEAREREAVVQRAREEADRQEYEEAERQQRARIAASSLDPADAAFDPYQVLGIQPGADADAIRAAYEAGKAKYDAEQVSHLSPEVQHHYQAKAAAVERAYLMLTTTA